MRTLSFECEGAYCPTEMQAYYHDGMAKPVYLRCRDALCARLSELRAAGEWPMPTREHPVAEVRMWLVPTKGMGRRRSYSFMHDKPAYDLCRAMRMMDGDGGFVQPDVRVCKAEDVGRVVVEVTYDDE